MLCQRITRAVYIIDAFKAISTWTFGRCVAVPLGIAVMQNFLGNRKKKAVLFEEIMVLITDKCLYSTYFCFDMITFSIQQL